MTTLDWNAERKDLSNLELLDVAPESRGIDLKKVRLSRLARLRKQMAQDQVDVVILSDPVNIRYANGSRNMQIFTARNSPGRYAVITATRSIMFEYATCRHLCEGLETIDEIREASSASFTTVGLHVASKEQEWAKQMGELVAELVGVGAVIGLERLNANVPIALGNIGFKITDAQKTVETARAIKTSEEIKCVVASLRATEVAVGKLRNAIRPGVTENALFSILFQSVIEQNGDYCETRLLNAGKRTNPWFQETTSYVIGENELIALDTDVVGCHGYYSDFSRSFHAGPDEPDSVQKELYRTAYEQIQYNISILKPGMTFRGFAKLAWRIPEKYHNNRYMLLAHGCGMACEYPYIYHDGDFPDSTYDGVIEPGMILSIESYIGEEGGSQGAKLEQQVLVTSTGVEILSLFPFEEAFLN